MLRRRPHRLLAHALSWLIGAVSGCGGARGEHPAPAEYDDEQARLLVPAAQPSAEAGAGPGACLSGSVRECKVLVGRQGSVENCFVGVQSCTDEAWGPCQSADQL